MTSKHLFFKAMQEDMRHKYWMLALSSLGSFLFMPVAWLILRSNNSLNIDNYTMTVERAVRYLNDAYQFFSEVLVLLAGCIAIAGALIVGLFGFRYVFHKNMVDTWHSLPIKRSTLFGACWLNGFLIWFVPFLIGMLLSVILATGYVFEVSSYANVPGMVGFGTLCKEAALTIVTMIVVFLVVYNTVLFAVMLSGNILNTLVSLAIIGFGVIGIYGLSVVYFEQYMNTFYSNALNWQNVVYGSPLFSAGCLLYARVDYFATEPMERVWQLGLCLLVNLLLAIALGVGAWILYKKRSSELAEQGIKNKPLIALMKLIVGVAGGMCGWLLMIALTNGGYNEIWGTFGCILVAVLAFGILDIIFHMDFKAFFAHKIQMGVTTVLAMLVCFAFCGDWFGYDEYLPDKEDIAYIGIYDSNFANRYFYGGYNGIIPLEEMRFEDKDVIYDFLERATGKTESLEDLGYYYSEQVSVKVTLTNGRSYYRYYQIMNNDKDVVWPLFTSAEYLEHTYLLDEEDINGCYDLRFERYDETQRISDEKIDTNQVRAIMEAYNQDLMNDPEGMFLGEGRMLAQINCQIEDSSGDTYELYLDIYDTMVNTIRVLKQEGYGKWVEEIIAQDVEALHLQLGYFPDINATPEELIALAKETYGYTSEADIEDDKVYNEAVQVVTAEVGGEPYLTITDKDEIAEILELCGYTSAYRSSIFSKGKVRITYSDADGTEYRLFLQKGALPEKYILRFGEIDLSEYGVADYYYYY